MTPVDPQLAGNGAALRASFWRRTLASMGDLTTIVVPIISAPPGNDSHDDLGDVVVVAPFEMAHDRHPALARRAPEYLGARSAHDLTSFDLVVGFRAHVAPFCFGLASMYETPVVIDLDDDDAAFLDAQGDHTEAARCRDLLGEIRSRAAGVASATGFDGTVTIPNVAGVELVADVTSTRGGAAHAGIQVVMVANIGYAPNLEGAHWLQDQVWPTVRSAVPDARLVIAGPGSEHLEHGIGFVDDLESFYASASVVVAPILHGSGTRIKILDAWARRIPVVATTIGIDGLDAVDEVHALIEDSPRHFADAVIRLLHDREFATALVEAASGHVASRFAEPVVAKRVAAFLRRVVEPPIGPMRVDGPVVTETTDGVVVDDVANGNVHHLDALAAMVYVLSDGRLSTEEITGTVVEMTAMPVDRAARWVVLALDRLIDVGLVTDDPAYERRILPHSGRPLRVRAGSLDFAVAHEVYRGGEYDIPPLLPEGTVVIDIGCHIGSFSARMIDSGAQFVIAIEPQPDNFRLATINLAGEIERGRLQLRQVALWSPPAGQPITIGVAPMLDVAGAVPVLNTGGHISRPATGTTLGDGEATVPSETLDDVVAWIRRDVSSNGPIWLKLDCEGAEWPVLATATCLGDLDVITAELHMHADEAPRRLDALVAQLESAGFEITITGDHRDLQLLRAERR